MKRSTKRDKLQVHDACSTTILVLNFAFFLGLRVAEIRAIFKLPSQFGHFSQPLAYVHWFKPFQAWDPQLGMFKLSRSTRHHRPNAAVICANQIVQTCHLIPKFGSGDVPRHWLNSNVLNYSSDFFFNRYLDFYLFEEFSPDDTS
jgi:hypothetical protein